MTSQSLYERIKQELKDQVLPTWEDLAGSSKQEIEDALRSPSYSHYTNLPLVAHFKMPSGRSLRFAPVIDGFRDWWNRVGESQQEMVVK